MNMDRSSVYSRDILDADIAAMFKPWIFETDEGVYQFDTEDDACGAQRLYRVVNGFHPISGEASAPRATHSSHALSPVDETAENA